MTIITLRNGLRITSKGCELRYSTYISGIIKVWYTTRQISTYVVSDDDLIVTITLRESQKIVKVGYLTQLDRSLQ